MCETHSDGLFIISFPDERKESGAAVLEKKIAVGRW